MTPSTPDPLTTAREAFAAWRVAHGRGRLPEALWTLALDALDTHSVADVARELGLNPARLRAKRSHLRAQTATAPKIPSPAFVELPRTPRVEPVPHVGDPHAALITIERRDGTRLSITIPLAELPALKAICALFLQTTP